MLMAILGGFDVANNRQQRAGRNEPWKLMEHRDGGVIVMHTETGKKFFVTVKEVK